MLNIISLGAGVQSSTMALMAAHGEITPMPDCAIFADVQKSEPQKVYEWLNWLEGNLPFPVHRVAKGSLFDALLDGDQTRVSNPPLFTEPDGMLRRKCTGDYKIIPIRQKVRELTGGDDCIQWIGISSDEAQRMKPSGVKYISHRWPLIEKNMTRWHCLRWMEDKYPGRVPPRSACVFCPFHDDEHWLDMKINDPESFTKAVAVDESIRTANWGTTQTLYLHRSRKPLKDVEFQTAESNGQMPMFGNECEGMCGV